MTRYFVFLRAINVGPRRVTMDRLRRVFCELGFSDASTYIASGNVTFACRSRSAARMMTAVEAALADELGYDVDVFVRTQPELQRVVNAAWIPARPLAAATAVNIGFLKQSLTDEQAAALQNLQTDLDRFVLHDREICWLCGTRQSESRISGAVLERSLSVRTTLRQLSTLRKWVEQQC